MAKYKGRAGGDLADGGKFIGEDGVYHLLVISVTDRPTKKNGEIWDKAAFAVEISVLGGTSPSQKDKGMQLRFNTPLPSHKDGGAMSQKIIDKFFLAVGLATREQIELKEELDIDLDAVAGRQFIAKIVIDEGMDKKMYPGLNYSDLWHVDDPAAKDAPKDEASLALIDPALRWVGGKPAASSPAPTEAPKPTEQAKSAPADDDYSSL